MSIELKCNKWSLISGVLHGVSRQYTKLLAIDHTIRIGDGWPRRARHGPGSTRACLSRVVAACGPTSPSISCVVTAVHAGRHLALPSSSPHAGQGLVLRRAVAEPFCAGIGKRWNREMTGGGEGHRSEGEPLRWG
jgi:hypothetical protein